MCKKGKIVCPENLMNIHLIPQSHPTSGQILASVSDMHVPLGKNMYFFRLLLVKG